MLQQVRTPAAAMLSWHLVCTTERVLPLQRVSLAQSFGNSVARYLSPGTLRLTGTASAALHGMLLHTEHGRGRRAQRAPLAHLQGPCSAQLLYQRDPAVHWLVALNLSCNL